jgi:hypothetical protein
MKRKILANAILILILAACSAPAQTAATSSATLDTNQQQAVKVTLTPQAQENYPAPATEATAASPAATEAPTEAIPPTPYPAPQATTGPVQTTFNPIPNTTRYGIPKVDAILDALLTGKSDSIPALIAYESAPCTKKEGLGGPPKCQPDEAEGTMVDVLPTMGPEGSFLPKSPDNMVDMAGLVELLGVFSVKADFKSEQYYPAGKYGIVLRVKNTVNMMTFRVSDEGIVRVDYITQMPDNTNQPDLDSFLKPKN